MRIYSWILGCFVYASSSMGLLAVVPDRIPCVLHLETHFFDSLLVNQGLSLYQVRQELWVSILHSLQKKSFEVPVRMKKRTAMMVPNPIEFPMQKLQTAKILKEVLFEVFSESMKENNVSGLPVNAVFEYVYSQQLAKFIECFGPEVRQLK